MNIIFLRFTIYNLTNVVIILLKKNIYEYFIENNFA